MASQTSLQLKRTSVSGRSPNTSILDTGELALNLADGILYSTNGSVVFEIGANTTSVATDGITLRSRGSINFNDGDNSHKIALRAPATVTTNVTFTLPDSPGTNTQVLTTDGGGNLSWSDAGSNDGGASTLGGLNDITISSVILNDILVYNGNQWINKNPHEIVPNIPFTKQDGTLQYLVLENKRDTTTIMGFLNDRVVQSYYVPFVKRDETSVTTLLLG